MLTNALTRSIPPQRWRWRGPPPTRWAPAFLVFVCAFVWFVDVYDMELCVCVFFFLWGVDGGPDSDASRGTVDRSIHRSIDIDSNPPNHPLNERNPTHPMHPCTHYISTHPRTSPLSAYCAASLARPFSCAYHACRIYLYRCSSSLNVCGGFGVFGSVSRCGIGKPEIDRGVRGFSWPARTHTQQWRIRGVATCSIRSTGRSIYRVYQPQTTTTAPLPMSIETPTSRHMPVP